MMTFRLNIEPDKGGINPLAAFSWSFTIQLTTAQSATAALDNFLTDLNKLLLLTGESRFGIHCKWSSS